MSNVDHPRHYVGHPSGVECIDVVEHLSFCLGNAIKYVWRRNEKGKPLEDLEKAAWYLRRALENAERRIEWNAYAFKGTRRRVLAVDPSYDRLLHTVLSESDVRMILVHVEREIAALKAKELEGVDFDDFHRGEH